METILHPDYKNPKIGVKKTAESVAMSVARNKELRSEPGFVDKRKGSTQTEEAKARRKATWAAKRINKSI